MNNPVGHAIARLHRGDKKKLLSTYYYIIYTYVVQWIPEFGFEPEVRHPC